MFEQLPDFEVVYIPDSVDPDEAIRVGAAWLRDQPGEPLVLVAAKKSYANNPLLPQLTRNATVASGPDAWKAGWRGGSVLAPWPSERVLSEISSTLARSITAVCVVEWGEQPFQSAWLEEHGAVSLLTGEPRSQGTQLLDPVVRFALLELSDAVNHNNALISAYEKSYAVRTLQQLVSAGYRFEVENLCAFALSIGFTLEEGKRLREYSEKILDGRSFRLREMVGPTQSAVARWASEAVEADQNE